MQTISRNDVKTISNSLVQAQVGRDVAKLRELLHEDYRGVNPDGSIVTKEQEIANLVGSGFSAGRVVEDTILTMTDVAVVVGTATFTSSKGEVSYRFTDVISGGKLIASQATRLT